MSFIRGAAATVPVINGIDANAYINTLPNVPSRPNCKRPPMGSTNRSADAGMLSVAGGSKPVVIKQPVPPPKSAALPTMHWTQRNASAAAGVQPSARSGGSVRARSVDTSHGRGSALSAAATASVSSSLSLTASHMSPIKQSLKGYQMDIARSKPETSKDVVEEMQRKAKLRADSWKRQLLADANSAEAQREAARKQKEQERLDAEKAAALYRARMYSINELMRAQEWAVYLHHSKTQPAPAAGDDSDSDHSPKGYMSPMKRSPSRCFDPPPAPPPTVAADACSRGGPLLSRDGSPMKGSPHTPARHNGV